jgi:hypothetical protein
MNSLIQITSPTGQGIRSDPAGDGHYGAKRGRRQHNGLDFLCDPGQTVTCPIEAGRVVRVAYPYETQKYAGLLIKNKHLAIKIFYLDPWPGIIGTTVMRGDPIGIAQDITARYNGQMRAHIHLAVLSFNPEILLKKEKPL